jgi:hypothetical protein
VSGTSNQPAPVINFVNTSDPAAMKMLAGELWEYMKEFQRQEVSMIKDEQGWMNKEDSKKFLGGISDTQLWRLARRSKDKNGRRIIPPIKSRKNGSDQIECNVASMKKYLDSKNNR